MTEFLKSAVEMQLSSVSANMLELPERCFLAQKPPSVERTRSGVISLFCKTEREEETAIRKKLFLYCSHLFLYLRLLLSQQML